MNHYDHKYYQQKLKDRRIFDSITDLCITKVQKELLEEMWQKMYPENSIIFNDQDRKFHVGEF